MIVGDVEALVRRWWTTIGIGWARVVARCHVYYLVDGRSGCLQDERRGQRIDLSRIGQFLELVRTRDGAAFLEGLRHLSRRTLWASDQELVGAAFHGGTERRILRAEGQQHVLVIFHCLRRRRGSGGCPELLQQDLLELAPIARFRGLDQWVPYLMGAALGVPTSKCLIDLGVNDLCETLIARL
jgi:hypothetical protein